MNILHDIWRQAVPGQGHEHLGRTLPPGHVVLWTPARYCRKEKGEVISSGQLFGWGSVAA